jgi:putative ABC transport system permease protein
LREQLLQKPFVAAVSGSGYMLDGDQGSQPIIPEGATGEMPLTANIYGVKHDFLELLGVQLLQGRFFSEAFASDAREAIVINKSTAQMLGWQDPIGKRLRIGTLVDGRVIGVAEDFHYASLHHEVAPLAIFVADRVENVYIKLRPGNLPAMLADIESAWRQIAPDQPFDVTFLDAHLQTLYESDRRFSNLVYAFSGLATFIACIGLFGLATYTSRQRTREIGIRKVLGAGVSSVVVLLSKEYIALVILANFVAWPLAWYAMNRWLQGFAYRIDLGWMIFALAGGLALLIALATVSLQTLKAALANPVDSLRCE